MTDSADTEIDREPMRSGRQPEGPAQRCASRRSSRRPCDVLAPAHGIK
jgi:hypothetical protein